MSEATKPQSGAEILARIQPRLNEESTEVTLRPDLLKQWEQANVKLNEMQVEQAAKQEAGTGRLGASASKAMREQAQLVLDLEDQIVDATVKFTFRAMPSDKWPAFLEQFPPRKGNDYDQFAGHNREAVRIATVRECLIDPVFDDESWAALLPNLAPSEWMELQNTAAQANGRVTEHSPKSALASRILGSSASASK